LTPN